MSKKIIIIGLHRDSPSCTPSRISFKSRRKIEETLGGGDNQIKKIKEEGKK
jgi:hypothetical protein